MTADQTKLDVFTTKRQRIQTKADAIEHIKVVMQTFDISLRNISDSLYSPDPLISLKSNLSEKPSKNEG